jgi:hypothetical protein
MGTSGAGVATQGEMAEPMAARAPGARHGRHALWCARSPGMTTRPRRQPEGPAPRWLGWGCQPASGSPAAPGWPGCCRSSSSPRCLSESVSVSIRASWQPFVPAPQCRRLWAASWRCSGAPHGEALRGTRLPEIGGLPASPLAVVPVGATDTLLASAAPAQFLSRPERPEDSVAAHCAVPESVVALPPRSRRTMRTRLHPPCRRPSGGTCKYSKWR